MTDEAENNDQPTPTPPASTSDDDWCIDITDSMAGRGMVITGQAMPPTSRDRSPPATPEAPPAPKASADDVKAAMPKTVYRISEGVLLKDDDGLKWAYSEKSGEWFDYPEIIKDWYTNSSEISLEEVQGILYGPANMNSSAPEPPAVPSASEPPASTKPYGWANDITDSTVGKGLVITGDEMPAKMAKKSADKSAAKSKPKPKTKRKPPQA